MHNPPQAWEGLCTFNSKMPANNASKKTVFIIADYKMTELFDMLAPFYLFNATEKANVYIVTKDKTPILVKRDLFVIPQITFSEVDSMKLQPDVIVIPALSQRTEIQDTSLINWIQNHFSAHIKMLAICDGASTAAATGFYDGKPITCHASDFDGIIARFSKPQWVQNVSVIKAGNLFSTAGVSNAVEGSLTVINELFGSETLQKVMANIHYPGTEIKTSHKSAAITSKSKLVVAKKLMFKKNKTLGLLIEDGVNEFDMASVIDTYNRTLPASFGICSFTSSHIQTKYGLALICTGNTDGGEVNELHVVMPGSVSKIDKTRYKNATIVKYEDLQTQYPIEICLKRIAEQYGAKFQHVVKLSLDYN
ncbi:hypothetical protein BH10BAC3_BH10BAC3_19890 [soil metagenome]